LIRKRLTTHPKDTLLAAIDGAIASPKLHKRDLPAIFKNDETIARLARDEIESQREARTRAEKLKIQRAYNQALLDKLDDDAANATPCPPSIARRFDIQTGPADPVSVRGGPVAPLADVLTMPGVAEAIMVGYWALYAPEVLAVVPKRYRA